jgi:eukaryotic-like serine/threonine-protein kinase
MAEARWLAMELAEAGTLEDVSFSSWARLRSVLLQLLDGLAHAHARQIIHRDLKPGNILVCTTNGSQIDIWLTDFGISHFRHTREVEGTQDVLFRMAVTPIHMAAEQLRGAWRDCGPWTDLYSLGCIAFQFAHGRPPFIASSAVDIAMMHMQGSASVLKPKFVLPDGFQEWLRRTLAKDKSVRFHDAAEASQMLRGPRRHDGINSASTSHRSI